MSANDNAWERFLTSTRTLEEIDRQGYSYVSADNLKLFGKREPRLMAKLDTLAERPSVFEQHELAILPVRNGHYVLFKDPGNRTYFQFSDVLYDTPVEEYSSEVDLLTYDAFPGSLRLNESQAIDFAYIASLLKHFTGDSGLLLTIRGRIYSGSFGFTLPAIAHHVEVGSVQIEVDAGYESPTSIYLIEAKIGRRRDFHIRQLYYPYLDWSTRSYKRVVPIFLTHTNGKYYFTEFCFKQAYGELSIVQNRCFVINESPRISISLGEVLSHTSEDKLTEPESVPFPQADDLDKVLDLLSGIEQGRTTKSLIAEMFEFDERQGDYYANAARYIGLVTKQKSGYLLTELGIRFLHTRSLGQRTRMLIDQLLMKPTYRAAVRLLQERNFNLDKVTRSEITALIQKHTTLDGSTPSRRALTVRSWLRWLVNNGHLLP